MQRTIDNGAFEVLTRVVMMLPARETIDAVPPVVMSGGRVRNGRDYVLRIAGGLEGDLVLEMLKRSRITARTRARHFRHARLMEHMLKHLGHRVHVELPGNYAGHRMVDMAAKLFRLPEP